MKKIFARFIASLVLPVMVALSAGGQTEPSVIGTNTFLVKGTVLDVRAKPTGLTALSIRIEEVYSGPKELCGRVFEEQASDKVHEGSRQRVLIVPVPKKGDEGIWALRTMGESVVPWGRCADRSWPSLPSFDKRYAQAEQLAQGIKSVETRTSQEEKIKTLSEYTISNVPEISQWATRALFDENREDVLLEGNAPQTALPIAGKLVADEMLVKRRGESWALSQTRFDMFRAMAETKKDAFLGDMMIGRLETIAQRKSDRVPPDILVAVILRIAKNREDPPEVRVDALGILRYSMLAGDTNAVEVLIDQVETGTPAMEQAATRLLQHNATFTDRQLTRLTDLKQKLGDPKRTNDIDAILRNGKPR